MLKEELQFLSNLSKIILSQKTAIILCIGAVVISFFVANKGKTLQKIDKNSCNRRSKNLYVLRGLMNFIEFFMKNFP